MAETTDTVYVWPNWLPIPRESYSYEATERSDTFETEMMSIKRRRFDVDETVFNVTCVFTNLQLAFFEAFEKLLLDGGTRWFDMPIYTSVGTNIHRVRMKSKPKYGTLFGHKDKAGMQVSFTVETANRKTLSKELADWIYMYGPEAVEFMCLSLYRLMHKIGPGATNVPDDYWPTQFNSRPAVLFPIFGTKDVEPTPLIKITPFSSLSMTDTYAGQRIWLTKIKDGDIATADAAYETESTPSTLPWPEINEWRVTPALDYSATYHVYCQYKGNTWKWGVPSVGSMFFTRVASISVPVITSPANGTTGAALQPTVTIGNVEVQQQTATHAEFQLSKTSDFKTILSTSGETGYKTSHTFSVSLDVNTEYFVRVRVKGSINGWTAWSSVVGFRTMTAILNAPIIVQPANGASGIDVSSARVVLDRAVFAGQTVTKTQVYVGTSSGANNIYDSGERGYEVVFGLPSLQLNTSYYVQARFYGSISGWTAWTRTSFRTMTAPAQTTWEYKTPGSSTFTAPVTGTYELECVGGGGGGYGAYDNVPNSAWSRGAGHCGGGGGGYAKVTTYISGGVTIPIVVGGGGGQLSGVWSQANWPTSSGDGGASSIGSYCSAQGGTGSTCAPIEPNVSWHFTRRGTGGTANGGTVIRGGDGGYVEKEGLWTGDTAHGGAGQLGYGTGGWAKANHYIDYGEAADGQSGFCRIKFIG